MKGTRLNRWISVMLSAMLVLTLFPVNALADDADGAPLDASDPTPSPVTITVEHTVKFVDWDNSLIDTVKVAHGEGAKAPAHPEREGYTADGWDKDFSSVEGDMTVTALYKEATDEEPTDKELPLMGMLALAAPAGSNSVVVSFYSKSGPFVASYTVTGLTDKQISDLPNKGSNLINALNAYYFAQSGSYFLGKSSFDNNDFTNNNTLTLHGSKPSYSTRGNLNFDLTASYTVNYLSINGNTIRDPYTGSGNVGETIPVTAPSIYGYTLISTSPVSLELKLSGNEVTFEYTPNTYTISYELNNGTNASGNPATYTPDDPTINLLEPTRTGYSFAGWSPVGVIPTGSYDDKTFEALWEPETFHIYYTMNNGVNSGANPDTFTPDDAEIVLLDPTRDGYSFAGWSPAGVIPTGTTEDQYFEAQWTANTYTIFYDLQGGVNDLSNPTSYTPDDETFSLLPASREGYEFAGWSPSGEIEQGSYDDIYVTAQWTPISYTIHYNLGGGTNSSLNPDSYTPEDLTITLQNPTRNGYTFNGWSPAGVIPAGSIGEKTFTASWKAITYKISYVMNGGTNPTGNPKNYTPDSPNITLLNPTRTGYVFAGWTPSNTIPTGSYGDKTFTANWTAQAYTITYNLNGGENNPGNPATYTILDARINLLPATRTGYTFVRWSPISYISAGSTGNKTFSAVWTPTSYRIYYNLGGGVNSLLNPYSYDIEDNTITLRDPSRIGYNFTGWTPEGVIPAGSMGEKTFTAGWSPKVYSISYELYGGTNDASNPTSYTIETDTIHLADASRPGYTFLGWLLTDTIYKGSVGDRTFHAVWSLPIRYSISYDLNGGVNAPSNPSRYWVVSESITLAAPTRTGYTFEGWTPEGVIPKGSTGDKSFSASWKPITYTISYDLAGGSAVGNPDSYTIETPTFMLNDPTRDHYTFAGWTPSNATIAQGSTGNKSFTAKWTPVSYPISYDLAGGSAVGNPDSYTIETPTFTLNDPTRDHYTFAGWTPEDVTIEQGTTGELSFTASWTPIVYNITYDLAGGSATGNPSSYHIETPTFTLNDPTRPGYDFAGWTPANATVETGSYGDLSFTAKWSDPNVYAITYDLAGGVNAAGNPASYTIESETITLAAPTRAGYDFTGWTPEGIIPAGSTGARAFTATWSAPIVYPIAYVMNGGINAGGNPATYTVESAAIALAAPTRAGYDFLGWTPAGGIPAGSTGARTFTANWSAPIEYDITYVMNGGVNAANPASYNVTSGLITLQNPTRTGYDFLGWTPTDNIPAASTGDRTFTATWSQPHVHTVTYFVSGGTLAGLDGNTPFAVYRDVAYGAPVPIPNDPAQDEFTFDGWSSEIPATMPDEDIVFYGSLTRTPVLQEIIANERTPLAAPTWSLLNLIFTALTALGVGSIISMLIKKRKGTGSTKNTLFSLLTLVPAAGAVVAFLLTQITSGSMVFADRWSLLMGGITLLQGALVALGVFGGKKA